jgi:hypothetical protein
MPITINGSGTLTGISAGGYPDATVTADDLAATLDLSGKTVTLASGVGGKIVNVAQVTIDSTSTFSSGSQVFARFAAMDAAYTTTMAGSKLLVTFSWSLSQSTTSADLTWHIKRKVGSGSASEILVNANPVGSTETGMIPNFRDNPGAQGMRISYSFLDTPGHSTAGDVITYEHHIKCEGSNNLQLNHGGQTEARHSTTVSTITFMEVAS